MQVAKSKECICHCVVNPFFTYLRGDDGNEYDFFSILPGLQFFSEHGYTSNTDIDEKLFRDNFSGVCGGLLDDWVTLSFLSKTKILASKIDIIDTDVDYFHEPFPSNISKCILWQDPIYGLFEVQYKNIALDVYYDQVR